MSLTVKQQRAEHVNQAVRIIADHGRRFFFNEKSQRYASIEVDQRGRIWWVDDYTGKRIYTHDTGFGSVWRGFSHGGTLRGLVKMFRDYISRGTPLSPFYLGPEREQLTNGNIWGYPPEDMQKVRDLAGVLPCFKQLEGEVKA